MNRISIGLVTLTTLALLAPCGARSDAQAYTITDLGTLGGKNSWPNGINNKGQVVGGAETSHTNTYWVTDTSEGKPIRIKYTYTVSDAFVWSPTIPNGATGAIKDLTSGSATDGSEANAINSSGTVVGYGPGASVLLWKYGSSQILATGDRSGASINDSGQIAGFNTFYSGGTLYELPGSGSQGYGRGINAAGKVVGWTYVGDPISGSSFKHALLWSPAVPNGSSLTSLDIGALTGQLETVAYAINNATASHPFQVVGQLGAGFLWDSVNGVNVPALPANVYDPIGYAINDSSVVVGQFQFWDNSTANWGFHPFVWDSARGLRDLNTLLPAKSGWTLQTATGINASGQIVGAGLNPHGYSRAYLLTP